MSLIIMYSAFRKSGMGDCDKGLRIISNNRELVV